MLKDFKTFVLRGNVVDLAVGIVVGGAFGAVVSALVRDLITPLLGIPGRANFSSLSFSVNHSRFLYGDFLNVLISFVSIGFTVFFFVVRPVNALMARRRAAQQASPATRQCPECLSDIPTAASRCRFCTAVVGPLPAADAGASIAAIGAALPPGATLPPATLPPGALPPGQGGTSGPSGGGATS